MTITSSITNGISGSLTNGIIYGYSASYAPAIDFDGTNDWLGEPAGVTTTATFASLTSAETLATISAWVKLDVLGIEHAIFSIASTNASRCVLYIDSTGQPQVAFANSSGVATFAAGGDSLNNAPMTTGIWYHIFANMDSFNGAMVYMNGSLIGSSSSSVTSKPFQANRPVRVGARGSSIVAKTNGKVAQLWFDNTQVTDLSKFYSGGNAVDLGTDGSTPTGSAPKLFLPFSNISNLGENPGSEVDLAVNGAPLQTTGPARA